MDLRQLTLCMLHPDDAAYCQPLVTPLIIQGWTNSRFHTFAQIKAVYTTADVIIKHLENLKLKTCSVFFFSDDFPLTMISF